MIQIPMDQTARLAAAIRRVSATMPAVNSLIFTILMDGVAFAGENEVLIGAEIVSGLSDERLDFLVGHEALHHLFGKTSRPHAIYSTSPLEDDRP